MIQKHVYLTPNNMIIEVYSNQLSEEDAKVNQRKININAMAKNIKMFFLMQKNKLKKKYKELLQKKSSKEMG